MADNKRHPFGGGIGDWVFETSEEGVVSVGPGAVVAGWSARSGGTNYTDLAEDEAGTVPITAVVTADGTTAGVDPGDYPIFYGPPGVRWMWVSADGGNRKIIFANDLAEDVAAAIKATLVTGKGDLLVGSAAGVVERLPIALADGQVLTAEAGQPLGMRWKTPAAGGGGGGTVATTSDTLWVAAVDAPAQYADAPYLCDGVADQVQIQAALNNALGLKVGLSPGTFQLSAPIQLLGSDNAAAELTRYLRGSGTYATTLVLAAGQAGAIFLGNAVSPHVADLRIQLPAGAGHGIYSNRSATVAAANRSFFHGSIRNVAVVGPNSGSTHTGWAFSLGSGFRYVVENVEAYGVGNGLRVLNEAAAFSCGDALIMRATMRVTGTNACAYQVSSPVGSAGHVTFDTCHAYGNTALGGTVGYKFDGAGATAHVKVRGGRADGFATVVSIAATAYNVDVDLGRVDAMAGGTFAAVAGYSSRVRVGLLQVASGTVAAITETNAYATKPNQYELDSYAETGATVTASLLSGVILRGVSDGGGLVAGVLKQKGTRGRTFTFSKTGTPAIAVGLFAIYNDTGNDLVLRSARASLGAAFTTGSTIADINLNAVSIFPGGTGRPTIAAAAKTSGRVTTGVDGIIWPAGQPLTVDIDAVGSAGPGAEFMVQIDTYN